MEIQKHEDTIGMMVVKKVEMDYLQMNNRLVFRTFYSSMLQIFWEMQIICK